MWVLDTIPLMRSTSTSFLNRPEGTIPCNIFASLIVALTYLGAESAQIFLQVPKSIGQIFQGLILFFLLGSDFLLYFKVKFLITQKKNEY